MKTENNFDQIKKIVLERAKENNACSSEYKRALESKTIPEICQVMKDNFNWGCEHKVITPEFIEQFKEDFAVNEIFVNTSIEKGFLLASGNATVRASGNATVRAWDNATVEAWDNAYTRCHSTIQCKISGKAIIRRWDINTIQFSDENIKFEKVDAFVEDVNQ